MFTPGEMVAGGYLRASHLVLIDPVRARRLTKPWIELLSSNEAPEVLYGRTDLHGVPNMLHRSPNQVCGDERPRPFPCRYICKIEFLQYDDMQHAHDSNWTKSLLD